MVQVWIFPSTTQYTKGEETSILSGIWVVILLVCTANQLKQWLINILILLGGSCLLKWNINHASGWFFWPINQHTNANQRDNPNCWFTGGTWERPIQLQHWIVIKFILHIWTLYWESTRINYILSLSLQNTPPPKKHIPQQSSLFQINYFTYLWTLPKVKVFSHDWKKNNIY